VVSAGLAVAEAALLATAIASAFMDGAGLAALEVTLAALAFVLAARAGVAWGQEWIARRCSAAVKSDLRMRLLRRAAMPSPGWGEAARSGEIVTLATRGLDSLDAYFARYLPQLVLSAIVPVAVVVCLGFADLVAAATVALTVPLIPLFMALIGSATERRRRRRWAALTRLSSHFLDVVSGLPTLRVFGRSGAQLGRLEEVTDDYRRESMATLRVAFLSAFALELAATLSVALVAVGVALRLVDGLMDLRTGLFVLILAPEAYLPLRALGAGFHASEEGLAAAGEAFRIIEAEPVAGTGTQPLPDLRGAEIRVEGVSVFQPGRAIEAPCEARFAVRRGEIVALSGPSGAGKSTLVDVLLGLRRADAGRAVAATADGRCFDLASLDREAWHRHVAWVPQHLYCFPGTVAENVRLAAPNASAVAVAEALAAVGLGELDPGTPLAEGGAGLSSGQRRRIGVARALLSCGEFLLLDEPTAGLDAASEATVLAAVRAAAREQGRAVVLVAHRPAALAMADRVVAVAARSHGAGEPAVADREVAAPAQASGEPE
jgi:ATP-binding cassette, subfamily C, bacterial CydCD